MSGKKIVMKVKIKKSTIIFIICWFCIMICLAFILHLNIEKNKSMQSYNIESSESETSQDNFISSSAGNSIVVSKSKSLTEDQVKRLGPQLKQLSKNYSLGNATVTSKYLDSGDIEFTFQNTNNFEVTAYYSQDRDEYSLTVRDSIGNTVYSWVERK